MDDEPIDDGWWDLMDAIDREHESECGPLTREELAAARRDGLVLLMVKPK